MKHELSRRVTAGVSSECAYQISSESCIYKMYFLKSHSKCTCRNRNRIVSKETKTVGCFKKSHLRAMDFPNTVNSKTFVIDNGNPANTHAASSPFFAFASRKVLPSPTKDVLSFENSETEYQYYLIGVYCFFGFFIAVGIMLLLGKKVCRACCRSKKYDRRLYESVTNQTSPNPHDNVGFEHHVFVDSIEVERSSGNNSDYDYHSEEDNSNRNRQDKPPAYEHPPSYEKSMVG